MNMQLTNLQQLRDAVISTLTRIAKECFQHNKECTPQRTEAVLRANWGATEEWDDIPSKADDACICI